MAAEKLVDPIEMFSYLCPLERTFKQMFQGKCYFKNQLMADKTVTANVSQIVQNTCVFTAGGIKFDKLKQQESIKNNHTKRTSFI